jgi:hypothetical protein
MYIIQVVEYKVCVASEKSLLTQLKQSYVYGMYNKKATNMSMFRVDV